MPVHVIEALRAGSEYKNEQERIKAIRQAAAEANQLAMERLSQENQQLASQHRIEELIKKSALIAHQAAATKQMQEMGQAHQETGAPLPEVEPTDSPIGNAQFSLGDSTRRSIVMPYGDQQLRMNVADPDTYAREQAARNRVALAPKIEGEVAKINAEKEADFLQKVFTEGHADKRNEATNAANIKRSEIAAAASRYSAQLTLQGKKLGDADFNIEPFVNDLYTGKLNIDQFNTETRTLSKFARNNVISAVNELKGVPINKNQQERLSNMEMIVGMFPDMKEYIEKSPDTDSWLGSAKAGITQGMDTKLREIYERIQANKAIVARTIQQQKGNLSNWEQQTASGGFIPDKFKTRSEKVSRYYAFRELVGKSLDSILNSQSPEQREIIKKRIGFYDVPDLQLKGGKKIKLQAPDGSVQEFDEATANHYISRGAKVVQ